MKDLFENIKPIIETPYSKFWIVDDVICGSFSENLEINLEIAKQTVQYRVALCEGRDRLCLIDLRGVKSTTKEARDYLANEGSIYLKAAAFIVNSSLTRALANFFIMIHKPKQTTRLFTDGDSAMAWLKEQE
jgi:hypothetical protein